jgi:MFS family permease
VPSTLEPTPGPADDRRARLLTGRLVLVIAAGAAYFLALGMLLPVVPLYVEDSLGGGSVAVGVAVGAFSVGAVLLRPLAGRIGDRFGRRALIVGGALVVSVSGVLYVASNDFVTLLAVRALGGVGEAAFFVGAGTLVTDLAPVDRRGEAISYWSVAVYGGLAFGPALGETLLGDDRFDMVWLVSAGLAGLAALIGLTTRDVVALQAAAPEGERRPLINRSALAPGLVLFLGLVSLAGFAAFVPLYVSDIGLEDSSGILFLYGALILVIRIVGARLPDRLGPLRAGTWATGVGALGMLVIAAWPTVAGLIVGTIVFASGMSLLYPAIMTLALTGVDESERASVVGTVSSFFDLSQGLGAFILGAIAAFGGYRGAFAGGAVFAVAGLVLLRCGIDPRTRRAGPADPDAAGLAQQYLEPDPP